MQQATELEHRENTQWPPIQTLSELRDGTERHVLPCMRTTGSCIYLTVAFLRVYKTDTWFKAIVKVLFTSLVYFIISLFIFIGIILIACYMVADML